MLSSSLGKPIGDGVVWPVRSENLKPMQEVEQHEGKQEEEKIGLQQPGSKENLALRIGGNRAYQPFNELQ